jgi:sensor histidine kinase YesM
MIPPVLLQPFVENAIEHGIRPLDTEGFLEINIRNAGEFTHFEIIDNGIGLSDKNKDTDREHATDIFLKRLKLRKFGEEKLFSISNRKDTQGTIVNLFLKLSYA